jgi:hypothetical protein
MAHRHSGEPIGDQSSIEAVKVGWLKAAKLDGAKRRTETGANDRAVAVDRLWTAPQRLEVLDPSIEEVSHGLTRPAVRAGVGLGDEASERRFSGALSAMDSPTDLEVSTGKRVSPSPDAELPHLWRALTQRPLHVPILPKLRDE